MMHHRRRMLARQSVTIMGVAHDTSNPSPILTRSDASVGKNAIAGIGSTPQVSDFDTMPIYRDIKVCNLALDGTVNAYEGDPGFTRDGTNGDVMVELPAYWSDIAAGTVENWRAANGPAPGFVKQAAFARGEQYANLDKIYVSAYEASAGYVSKSGAAPLVNITRAQARAGIAAKGTGWSQMDVAATMAINLLMYIEYATLDMQTAVGPGRSSGGSAINTGGSDGMAGHTGRAAGTADAVAMKWRGIENWWGNVNTFVDGINVNSGTYYWCLLPSNFADDTTNNYTDAGYKINSSFFDSYYPVYTKTMGLNTSYPWFRMPMINGGSATTYYCDSAAAKNGWAVTPFGGGYDITTKCGPAHWFMNRASSETRYDVGSRLMYLPQSA